jgi:muramoyltetrapeptide carboxypeptidase
MLQAPPYLKPGDKVAITAPASKLEANAVQIAVNILKERWGLQVVVGETIGASYHDFAGSDAQRASELQRFLDDDSVNLILAARGGYGVSKILDSLSFEHFSPKWICGFSDLTALLLHINSLGFQAIHGVMAKTMAFNEPSNESLKNLLFGGKVDYVFTHNSEYFIEGKAEGEAIGGNLCLLANSVGSKSDISYDGKILFLEDISEYLYSIDRMLVQLGRAGKLAKLAGLVVGDFSDCKENDEPFGKNFQEIILEHVSKYSYPVAFGFEFGHENRNFAIRMGETLSLEVNKLESKLKSI